MRFSKPRRALVSVVALLCLLHSVVGAGVVAGAVGSSTDAPTQSVTQETATPTNNTTQQRNPEKVSEQGNTDAVRSYLARKLAERLGESSAQISQGQYEQGRSVLGDEYNDLLDKYVDVEGGTDDNPAAESFEAASENQQEYASAVEEYNETYQEYQEAKRAGNTTRARELARELDRIEDRVNESGESVTQSFTRIENTTGADVSEAKQNVQNTSREIQEQQKQVVEETFVRTNLTVRTNASTVSFENPATVRGRLVLENGTALANETVRIRVGERTETVRTDGEGMFSIDYRPVKVAADAEAVTVAFLPAGGSAYLGSNASLDVAVDQVTADLTVTTNASTVQFGDELAVTGRAVVNGTPVPGTQVRVVLGGETIGTAVTDAEGRYRLNISLPNGVPVGDATVRTVIIPSDSAVQSDAATANIEVEPTVVSLSLNATLVSESQIRVSGTLRTADGRPLGNQEVELRVNGTTVATVETRRDGTFTRVVSVSESLSGMVAVRALYDQPSTNLERASARTRLDLETATERGEWVPASPELLGGGGVALLSLLAIGWLVRRRDEAEAVGSAPTTGSSESPTATTSAPSRAVLDQAASLVSAGESEAAIRALYAGVRQSIGTADSTQTHWEFYSTVSDRLSREAAETLERLTEEYERVVYSPDHPEPETAERLLDDSEALVGDTVEEASNAD